MRDDDHHADEQADRVPVDGAKGVVETDGADDDHRRAAEKGDAGAIEAQAGDATDGEAAIDKDENDRCGEMGEESWRLHDRAQIMAGSNKREEPPLAERLFHCRDHAEIA